MDDEYEVIIEEVDTTKEELIEILNKKLGQSWTHEEHASGFEIEVEPEWENVLREDASILWSYHKLGWKAMHYQKTDNGGEVIRQWLSFKNPNYKRGK